MLDALVRKTELIRDQLGSVGQVIAGRITDRLARDGIVDAAKDGLMVLDGERLSYRTLDVEQIGSVYETVMGLTVLTLPGPALAIRAGRNTARRCSWTSPRWRRASRPTARNT